MRKRTGRRTRSLRKQCIIVIIVLMILLLLGILVSVTKRKWQTAKDIVERENITYAKEPDLDIELLTPNEYSRPQEVLEKVKGIVIHYTANPGTTAIQNRNYFEGLKDSHITKASAHFIVGIEGEIVQCIPSSEISYASNERNVDTVSIECCHIDESGKFTEATYKSLIQLTAFLMGKFDLSTDDVIRHYDVTGKNCPKFYVENEDAWIKFKEDINNFILKNGEK